MYKMTEVHFPPSAWLVRRWCLELLQPCWDHKKDVNPINKYSEDGKAERQKWPRISFGWASKWTNSVTFLSSNFLLFNIIKKCPIVYSTFHWFSFSLQLTTFNLTHSSSPPQETWIRKGSPRRKWGQSHHRSLNARFRKPREHLSEFHLNEWLLVA